MSNSKGVYYFDDYRKHPVVLFDDIDTQQITLKYLTKLLDKYDIYVDRRRKSSVIFCPKIIIITSNLHPKDWYTKAQKPDVDALLRRFTKIVNMRMTKSERVICDGKSRYTLPTLDNLNDYWTDTKVKKSKFKFGRSSKKSKS